jgi:hypothetical protein
MLDAAPDRLSRWLVDQQAELGVPLAYVGSAQSVAYVPADPPADVDSAGGPVEDGWRD